MNKIMVIQGRELSEDDIASIRRLIENNPGWTRWRLSRELCRLWDWRNGRGQLKDMACRSLLLKLHQKNHIVLPPPACKSPNRGGRRRIPDIPHDHNPIHGRLARLQPLRIVDARSNRAHEGLFNCLLHRYHYLGFTITVGENMKYLALDAQDRPLACLLFGAPAWKARDRDAFIGWDQSTRKRNLNFLTNNTRFLVLPWVDVKNLASHVLGRVLRRLNSDWTARYGHGIYLVETFVDRSRFRGICYRAANWKQVGETTGRSRQDRRHQLQVPVKDIYIYPLDRRFRERLTQ